MSKILAIVQGCNGCPNKHYYSGGRYECAAVQQVLPPEVTIPNWCPLPDHPAHIITELERQNAELVAAAQEVREWLKNNSEHPPYCDIDDNGHGCTCGLTEFLLPRKVGTSTAAPQQSKGESE